MKVENALSFNQNDVLGCFMFLWLYKFYLVPICLVLLECAIFEVSVSAPVVLSFQPLKMTSSDFTQSAFQMLLHASPTPEQWRGFL